MGLDATNALLHIKSALRSSARLACQSASEYPVALGVGTLLLFLHRLCPALLALLLSSSPVFLLTALLLGALLSYGEPGDGAPATGDGEGPSPPDAVAVPVAVAVSTPSVAESCPAVAVEVQRVAAVAHMPRSSSASPVVRAEETTSGTTFFHEAHRDEGSIVASVSADDALRRAEVVVVEREEQPATKEICENVQLRQFRSSAGEGVPIEVDSKASGAVSLDARWVAMESSSFHRDNGAIAEGEGEEDEHVKEICQQAESAVAGRCGGYGVCSQYQFGELMSSCWQPVTRQDPCSESESDSSESSSDASISDIIPMLDELNPPVDLGAGHPSSAFREKLSAGSSDDEDGSEEDNNLSSDEDGEEEEEEEEKGDGNNWKGSVDPNSLEAEEKNGSSESLMARRRAKNALVFDLDRRLMDLQAADAVSKMEAASRFRVQVPSISTPRRPGPSDDPAEGDTVELPQIPGSAPPSVLLPRRKPSDDAPFDDQIVDRDRRLQETWTPPRSGFPPAQGSRTPDTGSLFVRPSSSPRHGSGVVEVEAEEPGLSGDKDAADDHSESESDSEEEPPLGSNGRLFGSLEPRIGDEIRILGAAVSDVCVLELEANLGRSNGGSAGSIDAADSSHVQKPVSSSGSDDADDSASADAGNARSVVLRPPPEDEDEDGGAEEHVVAEGEEGSMSEATSLFKCRMEQVLVQSVSEAGVGQPLAVRPGRERLSDALLPPATPLVVTGEARPSAEELLSSRLAQVDGEEALALVVPAAAGSPESERMCVVGCGVLGRDAEPASEDDANDPTTTTTHVPSSIGGGDIAGDGQV